MTAQRPRIAITAGEPAGIGLDLCVKLAQIPLAANIIVIADQYALKQRAQMLNLPLHICADHICANEVPHLGNGGLQVLHHALAEPVVAGQLNPNNSTYVLNTLKSAAQGCLNGSFDAMVTAPVHKGVINDAGIAFTGHTEYLAELTNTKQVVMMLVGGGMRVALATTHLAQMCIRDRTLGTFKPASPNSLAMRTNGSQFSCGGGASMAMSVPLCVCTLK